MKIINIIRWMRNILRKKNDFFDCCFVGIKIIINLEVCQLKKVVMKLFGLDVKWLFELMNMKCIKIGNI